MIGSDESAKLREAVIAATKDELETLKTKHGDLMKTHDTLNINNDKL